MFRLIHNDTTNGVKGWACSGSDVADMSGLNKLAAMYPYLQSSSYVVNMDLDTNNTYIYNADTKAWRLKTS